MAWTIDGAEKIFGEWTRNDDGPLEATEERSLPLAMEAFQMFLFG